MKNISKIMFALIANAVCNAELGEDIKQQITPKSLETLYKLAKRHDMASTVAFALENNGLLPEIPVSEQFKDEHIMAFYRYQNIIFEQERICDALEKAGIKHIPLKGAVLREFYPEPWLRTSCDIDILIEKSDIERASELLKKLGCKFNGRSMHDIGFLTEKKIRIELHYNLVAENKDFKFKEQLSKVWDYTVLADGFKYRYELNDEMLYFYHIAHIAVHFVDGGCGIKPIVDLWYFENRMNFDKKKRDELLQSGGLLKLAVRLRELSAVWFSGLSESEECERLGDFIIAGGVYGSIANRITLQNELKTGKLKYLLSRIFLPYERLKYQYPVIQNKKWLYPLFIFVRWTRLIFVKNNTKRQLTELKYVNSIENKTASEMQEMLKDLEI